MLYILFLRYALIKAAPSTKERDDQQSSGSAPSCSWATVLARTTGLTNTTSSTRTYSKQAAI